MLVDCQGQDYTGFETWIGDDWCDDGTYGFFFDCPEFSCDAGDCECSVASGFDCNGRDYTGYESWIGDDVCDDGTYGFYFNCDTFSCDSGDCSCGQFIFKFVMNIIVKASNNHCFQHRDRRRRNRIVRMVRSRFSWFKLCYGL